MKIKNYLCPCIRIGVFSSPFSRRDGCSRCRLFIAKLSIITRFLYYKDTNFICICKEKRILFSIKTIFFQGVKH